VIRENVVKRRGFLKAFAAAPLAGAADRKRPNILFCLGDNHSWLHIGAYGCRAVRTPHIDRLAGEGARFTNAFCGTPSCLPSRGGILTGQNAWRLEEGGNLCGTLPAKFPVYPDLLEEAGYHVGYTGKGYSPGSVEAGGRTRSPAGPRYQNFREFLKARPGGSPFCFWFGGFDFDTGVKPRVARDIPLQDIDLPPFLPDNEIVRKEFVRYLHKIEHFDSGIGRLLGDLEQAHELENTLIVVAADNGMEFPRCSYNVYDAASREYLIVRWAGRVKPGRVVDDFVSLIDLAPTFLETGGLAPLPAMTGRSLMNVLSSAKSGAVDAARSFVVIGRERHAWVRAGGLGYPMRAIRTRDYMYIRNHEPDRWPGGDPDMHSWPQGFYGDIDRGDTKTYMMEHRDDPAVRPLFELAFGKRPGEELYDLKNDPWQMKNVAAPAQYEGARRTLRGQLDGYLRKTGDPRALGRKPMWDEYPYYCQKEWKT
jgi:N-sulfoglucosamine sulfohydrolase